MKKMFTLFAILFFSGSLFAFAPQSLVTVSTSSRYQISVVIDNRNCNEKKSSDIMIKDIDAGFHNIKIYQEKKQWFVDDKRYSNQQLIYNGNICVKRGFHVDIVVNRFGKTYIDEKRIGFGWNDDEDDNCYDWNNHGHYTQPMSTNEFLQFKQTICNSSFDNTKLVVAKQAISANYFTSAQVKDLVDLFSFESSKLDIAKCAYRNSIDKNNYFVVSNALTFSSSKEELARFLATSR